MTISTTTAKIVYTGDESTTIFPYTFKIFDEDELVVSRYTVATGSVSAMLLNTDYVVSGVGEDSGGNITLTGSAVDVSSGAIYVHTGNDLVIQRVMTLTQEVDYVANDSFPAETHEQALDRLTMVDQQLQEQIDRCIKAPINQTTGSTTYTEVVDEAVASASSSATVAISNAAAAASSAAVSLTGETYATEAAASAVLCSTYAASLTAAVTRALDNLAVVAINESLTPGSSNYISLGSATKSWSSAYVWGTGHITTVRSTLMSGTTLNVSGTADAVTLRATLLTSTTLRVSGTTNAVTLAATLLSASETNISGTMNATNLKGDGSLLTGITNPIIQIINSETGTVSSGSTTIPSDNTIPQITEGNQYMTLDITPTASSNTLKIDVTGYWSTSGGGYLTVALFQNTTANAVACGALNCPTVDYPTLVTFTHCMTIGTTSLTTFKVRAGVQSGTTTFNGAAGTGLFGGALASSITITEIKA